MWKIDSVTFDGRPTKDVYISDGKPISHVRGPAGASFRLVMPDIGFLDLTDLGHVQGGLHYWAIDLNSTTYWYDGEGCLSINISNDHYFMTTSDGNHISGAMKPLPYIDEADINKMSEMETQNLIPYRNDPNGHKSKQQLQALGKQLFPFTKHSYELALSVYDWTTANFFRMDLFHLYRYTSITNTPLDQDQIVSGIWTANWPPYVPSDPDFMNSFMMKPAKSRVDVSKQLSMVAPTLTGYLDALAKITVAAKYSFARVSTLSKPKLYSGQVAISNLGESAFPIYFLEYPGNEGPVGTPMQMALEDALKTFMAPGNTLTLKSFLSFTDSLQDAMHYQNGIVLELSPPPSENTWGGGITYITPLSDESDKIEYTLSPGTQIQINGYEKKVINKKEVTIIYITFTGKLSDVSRLW